MSVLKSEDRKKWINAFIMLCSVLVGFIWIRFMYQLGEWFDLESQVKFFLGISQMSGILAGVATFTIILKNNKLYSYLAEVYDELVKVVWPESDTVLKLTVGIVIAVAIISGILLLVDYGVGEALSLIL